MTTAKPENTDDYIAGFDPPVQAALQAVRAAVRQAAPQATERISYGVPAFFQGGALVYFGGFRHHIGFYPPVRDPELQRESARYAGEKGNLRFPLSEPMPLELIARLTAHRLRENLAKSKASKRKRDAGEPGSGD
ncbi:MAG: DUF1801 domain-containing protein [Deltaproteobacteria bacterium]|nr:DUF1801 domain-containing protein [Deltaproteobacteria bacterium]